MNLVELKCKHCGAIMKVNSELDQIICNYCGSTILIDDEASEIKRVEKAKLDARIKNHEQDLKEFEDKEGIDERISNKKSRKRILKFSIVFAIIALLMTVVGFQDEHIICGIISTIQVILFVLTILLCDNIIKPIFNKDYKVFFWLGTLLSIIWLPFTLV